MEELRQVDRFSGLSEEHLQYVLGRAVFKHFDKGLSIFREGSPSSHLVTLARGFAKVYRSTNDGSEVLMGIFAPGDSLGELALVKGIPFPASAQTLSEGVMVTLPVQDYKKLKQMSEWFLRASLDGISKRAIVLSNRMIQIVDGDVDLRLKVFLKSLCDRFGVLDKESNVIELPFVLTRQEFACAIHARTETVIRAMSAWQKAKLVVPGDRQIRITTEFLQKLA